VVIFQAISAWIVVTFTIQRCLAVWFPMLFRPSARRRYRPKVVVTVVILMCAFFSLFKLFFKGQFESQNLVGTLFYYSMQCVCLFLQDSRKIPFSGTKDALQIESSGKEWPMEELPSKRGCPPSSFFPSMLSCFANCGL